MVTKKDSNRSEMIIPDGLGWRILNQDFDKVEFCLMMQVSSNPYHDYIDTEE